jgi:hypothetical protein
MLLKILQFALYTVPLSVQALQSRSCISYVWFSKILQIYPPHGPNRKHRFPQFVYCRVTSLQTRTWCASGLRISVAVVTWLGSYGNVFTERLPRNCRLCWLDYFGFQRTCHSMLFHYFGYIILFNIKLINLSIFDTHKVPYTYYFIILLLWLHYFSYF